MLTSKARWQLVPAVRELADNALETAMTNVKYSDSYRQLIHCPNIKT